MKCAWAMTPWLALALGCAVDATAVGVPGGGACPALTCQNEARGVILLPARRACATDAECVVRFFRSDHSGTVEVVGVPIADAADFDRVAATCANSAGAPPGPPFYEGGTAATPGAPSVATCRAGCCVAAPAP